MKKKNRLYICLGIGLVILFLASPAMNIAAIDMEGNQHLTNSAILEAIEYKEKTNIFSFSAGQAEKSLLRNPYVGSVEVKKDYFKRNVSIDITERKVSGYVKYNSTSYLYVDKEGRILEINSFFTESLPVVEGLEFNEGFVLGEVLKVDNKGAFDTMVVLANLFEKYEIEQDVIRVDVSDENEIHFYYGNIDVQLGSRDDLDLKVRLAMTIFPEIEHLKLEGGFLYLQDVNSPRFRLNS